MKKIVLITTVLIAMTITTNAQIPNGGFETWVNYVDTGDCSTPHLVYQTPDLWKGSLGKNCLTYSYSIQKNNESYPAGTGQFSMKIQPDTADGVRGIAGTNNGGSSSMANGIPPTFAINYRPASLYLYYKCSSFGGDTITNMVYFYKSGVVIGKGVFETTATVPTWTPLEIPINYTTLDVPDSATIFLMTGIYIQHSTKSTLYVDNLSFSGFVTSVPEKISENIIFNLYPNPANDAFIIKNIKTDTKGLILNIYDITGAKVKSVTMKQNQQKINIGDLNNGIYVVEIKSKEWTENQKLIIRK
jgi:hypothetical protein